MMGFAQSSSAIALLAAGAKGTGAAPGKAAAAQKTVGGASGETVAGAAQASGAKAKSGAQTSAAAGETPFEALLAQTPRAKTPEGAAKAALISSGTPQQPNAAGTPGDKASGKTANAPEMGGATTQPVTGADMLRIAGALKGGTPRDQATTMPVSGNGIQPMDSTETARTVGQAGMGKAQLGGQGPAPKAEQAASIGATTMPVSREGVPSDIKMGKTGLADTPKDGATTMPVSGAQSDKTGISAPSDIANRAATQPAKGIADHPGTAQGNAAAAATGRASASQTQTAASPETQAAVKAQTAEAQATAAASEAATGSAMTLPATAQAASAQSAMANRPAAGTAAGGTSAGTDAAGAVKSKGGSARTDQTIGQGATGISQTKGQSKGQTTGQSAQAQGAGQSNSQASATSGNPAGNQASIPAGGSASGAASGSAGDPAAFAQTLAAQPGSRSAAAPTPSAPTSPTQSLAGLASGASSSAHGPSAQPAQQMMPHTGNAEAAARVHKVQEIAVSIAKRHADGSRRFEIRLDPPELGRIDVRLEAGADGRMQAHLTVDKAETYDLLKADQRALERALLEAGMKQDGSSLNLSLRDPAGGRGGERGDASARGAGEDGEGARGSEITLSVEDGHMAARHVDAALTARLGLSLNLMSGVNLTL